MRRSRSSSVASTGSRSSVGSMNSSSVQNNASESTSGSNASANRAANKVHVAVRCRPLNDRERISGNRSIVHCSSSSNTLEVEDVASNGNRSKKFTFDHVFDENTDQPTVYDTVVSPIVQEVLKGYNCTVFAYGQTGTGKTYTMEGKMNSSSHSTTTQADFVTDENNSYQEGVIPRAVNEIFDQLTSKQSFVASKRNKMKHNITNNRTKDRNTKKRGTSITPTSSNTPTTEFSVRISFLELYNEVLEDLLASDATVHHHRNSSTASTTGQQQSGGNGSSGGLVGNDDLSRKSLEANHPFDKNKRRQRQSSSGGGRYSTGSTGSTSSIGGGLGIGSDMDLSSPMTTNGTATNLPPSSSSHGSNSSYRKPKLRLCDDPRKGVVCQNLEEVIVHSASDVFSILNRAISRRRTAATLLNRNSSRSHSIFSITIHTKETTIKGEDLLKVGKLNLVDLAGSECIGRSGAKNKRAREAGSINQSLLTLGRVITALVDRKSLHIPYRDSKLTRLLQESLGGKAKTTIIATVTPSEASMEETLSTLDYASRAKSITNRPECNQRMTKRALIKEYAQEIKTLKQALNRARAKDGVYLSHESFIELNSVASNSQKNLEQLEDELMSKQLLFDDLLRLFKTSSTLMEKDIKLLHSKLDRKASIDQTNQASIANLYSDILTLSKTFEKETSLLWSQLEIKRKMMEDTLNQDMPLSPSASDTLNEDMPLSPSASSLSSLSKITEEKKTILIESLRSSLVAHNASSTLINAIEESIQGYHNDQCLEMKKMQNKYTTLKTNLMRTQMKLQDYSTDFMTRLEKQMDAIEALEEKHNHQAKIIEAMYAKAKNGYIIDSKNDDQVTVTKKTSSMELLSKFLDKEAKNDEKFQNSLEELLKERTKQRNDVMKDLVASVNEENNTARSILLDKLQTTHEETYQTEIQAEIQKLLRHTKKDVHIQKERLRLETEESGDIDITIDGIEEEKDSVSNSIAEVRSLEVNGSKEMSGSKGMNGISNLFSKLRKSMKKSTFTLKEGEMIYNSVVEKQQSAMNALKAKLSAVSAIVTQHTKQLHNLTSGNTDDPNITSSSEQANSGANSGSNTGANTESGAKANTETIISSETKMAAAETNVEANKTASVSAVTKDSSSGKFLNRIFKRDVPSGHTPNAKKTYRSTNKALDRLQRQWEEQTNDKSILEMHNDSPNESEDTVVKEEEEEDREIENKVDGNSHGEGNSSVKCTSGGNDQQIKKGRLKEDEMRKESPLPSPKENIDNLELLRVAELRSLLKTRGLESTGKKTVLIQRLRDANNKGNNNASKRRPLRSL
eukprot:g2281.t1